MAIQKIPNTLIADNAVTASKIANGTLTADDIAANSITAAKLSASTSPTFGGLTLKDDFGSGVALTLDRTENSIVDTLFYLGVTSSGSAANDRMWFGTSTTDLTITDDGTIGIGTDSPASELHVKSSGTSSDTLTIENSTGNGSWRVKEGSSSNALLQGYNASNSETIRLDPTSDTFFNGGRVGIGTTDPKSTLEVKGTFGAPATSGFALGFISRFSQTSGVGSLDVGFGDPYSWLQSRASNNYAVNYNLALNPNGGNVGIGTSSPAYKLDVNGSAKTTGDFNVYGGNSGSNANRIALCMETGGAGRILVNGSGVGTNGSFKVDLTDSSGTVAHTLTYDSSGNLLVGTTDDAAGAGNTLAGVSIRGGSDNRSFFSVSSNYVMHLNRNTNDGNILEFAKNGSGVGSIGTEGTDLTIGSGGAALQFLESENRIRPWNMSTNGGSDNVMDLGRSSQRFNDLYLGGGVFLGGTGAANYLDDYEEGTFTPNLSDGTNSVSLGTSSYRKIGSIVTVFISKYNTSFASLSATSLLRVTGLPFTQSSGFNTNNSLATNTTSGYQVVTEITGTTAFIYLNNNAIDYVSFTRNSGVGGASTFTFRTIMVYSTDS